MASIPVTASFSEIARFLLAGIEGAENFIFIIQRGSVEHDFAHSVIVKAAADSPYKAERVFEDRKTLCIAVREATEDVLVQIHQKSLDSVLP